MVKITKYTVKKNKDGGKFIVLTITGGVSVQRSETTGNPFVSTLKTNILANVDEQTAKAMIGQELPGSIVKQACEPYQYTTPDGETKLLEYSYQYLEEEEVAA
jgi:hypothetical protein